MDAESTTITAQFPGTDPNAGGIEINVRQSVFYPSQTGSDFITVRGFTLEHSATNWAPPTGQQVGLISTHLSKGWIIENKTIRYSTCTGVTLGKHGDKFNNTSANSTEGYVETIKRGLAAGWSKENIGGHMVRNNHISHCEEAGIVGSLGAIREKSITRTLRSPYSRQAINSSLANGLKNGNELRTFALAAHRQVNMSCSSCSLLQSPAYSSPKTVNRRNNSGCGLSPESSIFT